ncbi:MAG: phosphoenolpyruvate--protein phosphotransferase [Galactobacillus timonensis]|jgi:phosphotransferase system enzyme I (PtsI)|uniref:phosphoenolpyruvate--protein phosphotransferase n=1 Tax=Galactobacillus timonensis TaxID=2041840 RepID=UPI0023F252AC|nr:phosphoenolpyruvate--protein phosphotransferase [Galactobacillus timonensis]MDY5223412.1 phosphoenolpyruvate--protein phosphotransferase [Lachnospiraceae bacterium]MDY6281629.1 phosphoenolpyruvate--protein phosphotransferase [Erysipelotrichaceae bacterium]MCI6068517.1 phosphoenolpyruvate--protein phosphotransferase [Galactobacillus timonensis]MCI6755176.1 phosphoenolpyruvate--protein phosphotransferase [Galactobacillus timonensis]MDD7087415.1 phosphoenolpyruvate--protein phosphotransferase 
MLKGIAASQGVAVAKVYKLEQPVLDIQKVEVTDLEAEKAKIERAFAKTVEDIEKIKETAAGHLAAEELAIYDAHLMMAQDPEFKSQILDEIENSKENAEYAAQTVASNMVSMFENMDDSYFKERAADIKDVSFRLLCNLTGKTIPNLATLDSPVIIVAKDLTPSDTGSLNKEFAKGFATEMGGRTSHSAIMARSLEIPAVVGVKDLMANVKSGDTVVLDAIAGEVIVNPDEKTIAEYKAKGAAYEKEKEELKSFKDQPSVSTDGHKVLIVGNIGSPADVQAVRDNGGEGVGLFRTEFLYMKSEDDFPNEDTQFAAYKEVLEAMQGKPVVIRTLDIGGDKKLKYYQFAEEMNPFLGVRAIRFCLQRKDIFRTQLRALLRASAYGHLCIMFPMIATVNEFKEAKQCYEDARAELIKEGVKVGDDVEVGCMIEIPAAAVLADQLAKYADFFSIGTNDLIQYSMAADRMSQSVSYLYQPLNPSILRLIKMTIDGAHKHGHWCGMCGEMAGDELAAPVLLGLGLDEFSMSATSMLRARRMINGLSYAEMQKLADKALEMDTMEEVSDLIKSAIGK